MGGIVKAAEVPVKARKLARAARLPQDDLGQAHLTFGIGVVLLLVWYGGVLQFWRAEWFGEHGFYSHAPLVPVLAAFLVWMRRQQLAHARVDPSFWGLGVIALGGMMKLGSTWISKSGVEAFASVSFPILLWGVLLAVYGWQVARTLSGPAAFLWLMCPMPGYTVSELSFPLQLGSTQMGVALANALGIGAWQDGTSIQVGGLSLFVDTACSGLKAVLGLLTLSAFAALTSRLPWVHKGLLIAAALPLGLLTNGVRIAAIVGAASVFGKEGALLAHDYSGLVALTLACLGVWGVAKVQGWLAGIDTW